MAKDQLNEAIVFQEVEDIPYQETSVQDYVFVQRLADALLAQKSANDEAALKKKTIVDRLMGLLKSDNNPVNVPLDLLKSYNPTAGSLKDVFPKPYESSDENEATTNLYIKGNTLIHLAVMAGNFDVVKHFLTLGCDPNVKNKYGDTPLHLAVGLDEKVIGEQAKNDVIKELRKHGARLDIKNHYGLLPFACCKVITVIPIDDNDRNYQKYHLGLNKAVLDNNLKNALYFLNKGADPAMQIDNDMILYKAYEKDSLEMVALLHKYIDPTLASGLLLEGMEFKDNPPKIDPVNPATKIISDKDSYVFNMQQTDISPNSIALQGEELKTFHFIFAENVYPVDVVKDVVIVVDDDHHILEQNPDINHPNNGSSRYSPKSTIMDGKPNEVVDLPNTGRNRMIIRRCPDGTTRRVNKDGTLGGVVIRSQESSTRGR